MDALPFRCRAVEKALEKFVFILFDSDVWVSSEVMVPNVIALPWCDKKRAPTITTAAEDHAVGTQNHFNLNGIEATISFISV